MNKFFLVFLFSIFSIKGHTNEASQVTSLILNQIKEKLIPPSSSLNEVEANLKNLHPVKGFKVNVYALAPGARSMALSSDGTLFVGTGGLNEVYKRIYAIRDLNHDGIADEVKIIADGLNVPNGVAYKDGDLYVAELSRILRFRNIEKHLDQPKFDVFYSGLPSDSYHGWKYIKFAPDGSLIVPQGAPCNVCEVDDKHAGIYKISPDGKKFSMIAKGVRNTVGFDFDPKTSDMIFSDNGRDMLGDNTPPCEINKLPLKNWQESTPLDYGFPYCHSDNIKDPKYFDKLAGKKTCEEFRKPILNLGAHVAPLGVKFYTGSMFPSEYKNQIFIAEHGSWNRSIPQGYRVSMSWTEDGGKFYKYKIFLDGWLTKDGKKWGRPVDLAVMKDGSLLISDDLGRVIYRVTYSQI